jgi:hypothetical protein
MPERREALRCGWPGVCVWARLLSDEDLQGRWGGETSRSRCGAECCRWKDGGALGRDEARGEGAGGPRGRSSGPEGTLVRDEGGRRGDWAGGATRTRSLLGALLGEATWRCGQMVSCEQGWAAGHALERTRSGW